TELRARTVPGGALRGCVPGGGGPKDHRGRLLEEQHAPGQHRSMVEGSFRAWWLAVGGRRAHDEGACRVLADCLRECGQNVRLLRRVRLFGPETEQRDRGGPARAPARLTGAWGQT